MSSLLILRNKTVQKEQGIIGQEIRMYDDDPQWRVMFNLLGALYHTHPVKNDICRILFESISHTLPLENVVSMQPYVL